MSLLESEQLAAACGSLTVSTSGTQLACAAPSGSTDILVFERQAGGGGWRQTARLDGHDAAVSGLEWFSGGEGQPDKLASASHDRNAFVFSSTTSAASSSRSSGGEQWHAGELVITK